MARKPKRNAAASKDNPKKPGPSGNFQGLRLQYLQSELDTFLSRVQTKSTPAYWPKLFAGYWKRVQWRFDLSVETDREMFKNTSVPIDNELSAVDEVLKKETLKSMHMIRKLTLK
jgi:hypothetical protein